MAFSAERAGVEEAVRVSSGIVVAYSTTSLVHDGPALFIYAVIYGEDSR